MKLGATVLSPKTRGPAGEYSVVRDPGGPDDSSSNMAIGIPAIALFVYVFFGPWQQYRRTTLRRDWPAAHKAITRLQVVMRIILVLGLVAAVGRLSLGDQLPQISLVRYLYTV